MGYWFVITGLCAASGLGIAGLALAAAAIDAKLFEES